MTTPVTLPFSPGGTPFNGAMLDLGGVNQALTALRSNAAPALGNWIYSTVAGGAFTLTPANCLGGIFVHTGAAGAINVATPTGAQLAASWPGLRIGATAPLLYANLNNGTDTITAGDAAVTLTGVTTIVTVAARLYVWECTACPAAIVALSYLNGTVTLTTNIPHGLAVGGSAIVVTPNTGFNGTFTIATVPNALQLTYALAPTVAYATNPIQPALTAQSPGLLNTASTFNMRGCFAWPATVIA